MGKLHLTHGHAPPSQLLNSTLEVDHLEILTSSMDVGNIFLIDRCQTQNLGDQQNIKSKNS